MPSPVLREMAALRKQYHTEISSRLLSLRDGVVNLADRGSRSSRLISDELADRVGGALCSASPSGQSLGSLFASLTCDYLAQAFGLLAKFRPGEWEFSTERPISGSDQYRHLAELNDLIERYHELQAVLGARGDYIITPDVVVYRLPLSERDLPPIAGEPCVAAHTPLIGANHRSPVHPILHASVSCKWTIRSDRAQNTRTEALNLIRNRKGRTPHIVAVTSEPLPMRIASLALGTGDLDCVYHFALHELCEAVLAAKCDDQNESLQSLIEGRRLRDISDLPFDLAT